MRAPADGGGAAPTRDLALAGTAGTLALARRLARSLAPGALVLLRGEMGTGKTTLVRFLVEALGGDPAAVSSPTYTLRHAYAVAGGILEHVDAWRLGEPGDLDAIGALEPEGPAIVCIEWPERIAGLVDRPGAWLVTLAHAGEGNRSATIRPPGSSRILQP